MRLDFRGIRRCVYIGFDCECRFILGVGLLILFGVVFIVYFVRSLVARFFFVLYVFGKLYNVCSIFLDILVAGASSI